MFVADWVSCQAGCEQFSQFRLPPNVTEIRQNLQQHILIAIVNTSAESINAMHAVVVHSPTGEFSLCPALCSAALTYTNTQKGWKMARTQGDSRGEEGGGGGGDDYQDYSRGNCSRIRQQLDRCPPCQYYSAPERAAEHQ